MAFNVDATIKFLKAQVGHTEYSMEGSRNFSDGTCDCSGAVYTGLVHGGIAPMSYIPSTETEHAWLKSNGFTLIAENSDWNMQKGDVVIWGRLGYSGGAGGHTGICIDNQNWLECTAYRDLGETIQNHDARWNMCGQPYFYVYRYNGATTTDVPAKGGTATRPASGNVPKVITTYGFKLLNGGWLDPVTNFNNVNGNGYAGDPCHSHDLLYISTNHGYMKYRVFTAEDGWLPWVTKGNKNDTANGCAGIVGHAIQGVQMIYITPPGEPYQQAYYRSQSADQNGWFSVCCDDGNSIPGFDWFAGYRGQSMDRLQIAVAPRNPF